MKKRQMLGLSGALLIVIGVFTPIISVPIFGGVSLWKSQTSSALALICLALVIGLFILNEVYKVVRISGIVSSILIGTHLVITQYRLSSAQSNYRESVGENPFASIGQALVDSVSLDWGWLVLLLGAGATIASAHWTRNPNDSASDGFDSGSTKLLTANLEPRWGGVAIATIVVLLIGYNLMSFLAGGES